MLRLVLAAALMAPSFDLPTRRVDCLLQCGAPLRRCDGYLRARARRWCKRSVLELCRYGYCPVAWPWWWLPEETTEWPRR